MELTGKQKTYLRGRGQLLDPVVHVGKEGVSEECVTVTLDAFRTRELLKVRVLKTAPATLPDVAAQLAEQTDSYMAGKVGFTFLLYKPNPEIRNRLELPARVVEATDEE